MLFDFSDNTINHTTIDENGFSLSEYSYNDGSWKNYEENFMSYNTPYGETFVNQDFSSANLSAEWKSKEFVFSRPIAFSCARINFNNPSGTVKLKLFAENRMVYQGDAVANKAFRLPVLRRECKWAVAVQGDCDITSIELAESMSEM